MLMMLSSPVFQTETMSASYFFAMYDFDGMVVCC